MKTVIACRSIKPELERMKEGEENLKVKYLPQNLHRTPDKLREMLQNVINKFEKESDIMVLGYGLCSNGIVGVRAPQQGLYIPRTHDCIAFYLGSRENYKNIFGKHPGTYHLTKSWIDNKKDPLGLVENEYTERVGRELAEETMKAEIKNYEFISYVNTNVGDDEKYRKRARENADFFNKKFIEYNGSADYFKKIIYGPYDTQDFVFVKPNDKVNQKEFLK
ncbi:MAG: DUF1638 domain-containing protein [Bacteroidales bacterium]